MRTHLVGGPNHGLALLGGLGPERVVPTTDAVGGHAPAFREARGGEPCYVRRVVALAAARFHGIDLAVGDEGYEWQEGD